MLRSYALVVCAGMVLLSAGCGGGDDSSREPVASFSLAHVENRDVDVLFVIPNTASTVPLRDVLTDKFSSFVNVLENLDGGLPNLHLGVVTTDVDTGPYEGVTCAGAHDNGALQSAATSACTPPDGAFISDVDDGTGSRTKNYTGTLAESFSCIAGFRTDGCVWPQPLEAMKRALDGSNPGNAGFLRSDAVLSVVFVTRVDDCSASDTNMFDPTQQSLSDPLGPLTMLRCFEFGVQCDPDTPRTLGTYEDCVPRENSAYMYDVNHFVNFLGGLKDDPGMIVVADISGDPSPVTVSQREPDYPESISLEPICEAPIGLPINPAIRLPALADAFPGHGVFASICEDMSDNLIAVAEQIGKALKPDDLSYTHCLDRAPADTDAETPGLQANCEASQIAADQSETQLAACDQPDNPSASGNLPCFVLHETALCDDSGVMIETFHATAPAAGDSVALSCSID